MIDTRDIIQETYIDTDNTNTNATIPIDTNIDIETNTDIILDPNATINMQNERLFNTGDNKIITLDNFVISKKPKYVINYPIVKDENLFISFAGKSPFKNIDVLVNINSTGILSVDGLIITKTGFSGYTGDADLETLESVLLDGGEY